MADSIKRGIRKSSGLIVTLAPNTPIALYQLTTGASGNVHPRTVGIKKIWCYSDVGNSIVLIGTGLGAGWVQQIPAFQAINRIAITFTEDDIPDLDLNADITFQADLAGVDMRIEVEERDTNYQFV